jgi:hypothetical protein
MLAIGYTLTRTTPLSVGEAVEHVRLPRYRNA